MADVIVTLPVKAEESNLFGRYLSRFMESRFSDPDPADDCSDAPYLMMRSDPGEGHDIKVLTFQEPHLASDFSSGWAEARMRRAPSARA